MLSACRASSSISSLSRRCSSSMRALGVVECGLSSPAAAVFHRFMGNNNGNSINNIMHSSPTFRRCFVSSLVVSMVESQDGGALTIPTSSSSSTTTTTTAAAGTTDVSQLVSTFRNYSEDVTSMSKEQLLDYSTIPGFLSLLSHSLPKNKESTPRNALVGMVVSDKMSKTVNVAVDRYRIVPKYRKRMKYTRKFMAHDEHEVCQEGDCVMIVPCQKLSKMKHFRVHSIVRAKGRL